MRKIIYIILFFLWAIPSGFAQLKTYSFEEVVQLSKENPKPIVVFTHTNWCKYCKIMEHVTFKDSRIIATLNENFYCYTGGAHGNTERVSQTWNMKTGNLISLCTILNHDCSSFLLIYSSFGYIFGL